jgi:hypothetical protein
MKVIGLLVERKAWRRVGGDGGEAVLIVNSWDTLIRGARQDKGHILSIHARSHSAQTGNPANGSLRLLEPCLHQSKRYKSFELVPQKTF